MIKELFHIKQQDGQEAAQLVLSIQVGERHCGIAVTNKAADQLYELAYYLNSDGSPNPLPEIMEQHAFLKNSYYQVLIGYDHPKSVLSPTNHYNAEEATIWLKGLLGVNGTTTVIAEQVSNWHLHNIYSVPKELHDWTSRHFSSGKYWHGYSIQLKQLIPVEEKGILVVDFRNDVFVVIAAEGKKLLLAQSFPYTTPADVLYYLLKVCSQFGLLQETVNLYLSGLIDQGSALYKELYQYFINVEFRNADWSIADHDYPAHFFTSLNDLAKCAS